MSDPSSRSGKPSLGADLVIPGLGVALALYFFTTVAELPWEAKANALAIGLLLLLLVAIFVMRIVRKVMRGEATLGFEKLFDRPSAQWKRLWLVVSLVGFIVLLPWLGFTVSLFFGMLASMLVMGVREPRPLLGTAFGVAVCCYLMFIALLDTNFPHGPIEKMLAPLFGG